VVVLPEHRHLVGREHQCRVVLERERLLELHRGVHRVAPGELLKRRRVVQLLFADFGREVRELPFEVVGREAVLVKVL